MVRGLIMLFLLLFSIPAPGYDPTDKMSREIIQQQKEVARSSRAELIEQKRYRECNEELTKLAEKIRAESRAKGNPEGKVTFGTGPKDVDFYLGLRFMELQRRCEELKDPSLKTQKSLERVKDIPSIIAD